VRILPLIVALTVVFTPFAFAQAPSASGLEGTLTIRPSHPGPEREGEPAAGLANTSLVAVNKAGVTTRFATDEKGRFHLLLEPGHYTITLQNPKPGPGRFGPWEVDVLPGQITKVDWQCDSGMR